MKKKVAFVLGGSGLIGNSIISKFDSKKVKVIILDIKKPYNQKQLTNYFFFDLSDLEKINENLIKACNKYGCPDFFINTSYPYKNGWSKINYENIKLNDLRNNIDIHLNSFAWSTFKITEIMKKNKKKDP